MLRMVVFLYKLEILLPILLLLPANSPVLLPVTQLNIQQAPQKAESAAIKRILSRR